ncbi:MMPL family transporter [Anaeromyxobacter oryzae]|uniref:Transporter n=1 Tax=Anaeromyxobacter oryzae TaxID=2918170 RepID=A0ABN6MUC2_9BACT|nr:MMPL family transporter [Anaeromyxobacter oryzae]BDG03255.1 transporter [Anaeromyxobacter oryzae]
MRLAERWVHLADRRRGPILAACAIAALVGVVGTVRLYTDLRPDMSELLPANSRSARDLETVTERVGGYAEETIVLAGKDPLELQLLADDLADRLSADPEHLIRWVEYRVDETRDFFKPRLLLFLSRGDLVRLRDTLGARVAWERARAAGKAEGAPPDVEGLLQEIAGERKELLERFPTGYVMGEVPGHRAGETMTALAMVVRLDAQPDDFGKVTALDRYVKKAVAELRPAEKHVEVGYGGYVASNILEHDALAEDLVWATILVLAAVAAAVAVYNRTWKAIFAVGIPLISGTMVTFGIAELLVGHLNSNTAFLGSIVVGNGINVGLILFARYLEERRHGYDPAPAMQTALSATWLATLTAALAAGVSYASLMSTDFRGFNQFGLIGGIGMTLSWIFAYLMTPPLVLAWERRAPIPRAGQRPARPVFTRVVSHAVDRAPRVTAVGALLLTVASVFFIAHFARDPIEFDFRKLRDQSALAEGGPAWWDARVDALHGDHLSPTVLLGRDEAEARRIAAALEAERKANPETFFGQVLSVAAFVPEDQEAKLPVVQEIRALATPENLRFLSPEQQLAVKQVLPPPELRPFGAKDLPEALRRQLTEVDGRAGTPVLVYPAQRMDVWNGRDVVRFAEEIRRVPLPRADIPMASSTLVFADVLYSIEKDGPRATLLSLLGVVLLVLVAFGLGRRTVRSLSDAGWVLASLAVGVIWFGGLAGALHLRLNMLNFIALPITFGIGVDYATNIFQRRRLDHARSIAEIVRTTGGAVALCSLTTIIGYSSLIIARNQALISFGVLADLGEVACLAAALFALPAVLRWRELVRERRAQAAERVDVQAQP